MITPHIQDAPPYRGLCHLLGLPTGLLLVIPTKLSSHELSYRQTTYSLIKTILIKCLKRRSHLGWRFRIQKQYSYRMSEMEVTPRLTFLIWSFSFLERASDRLHPWGAKFPQWTIYCAFLFVSWRLQVRRNVHTSQRAQHRRLRFSYLAHPPRFAPFFQTLINCC